MKILNVNVDENLDTCGDIISNILSSDNEEVKNP